MLYYSNFTEGVELRNEVYKLEAPKLSLEAAREALRNWGGDPQTITHVVAVSCTGIIIPGLEFHVMTGLGLSIHTQRLNIGFMGCFGALSGMKAARSIASERLMHAIVSSSFLFICDLLC